MKSLLVLITLVCAAAITSSSAPLAGNTSNVAKKERAEVRFANPVQLMGVTLQGQYLFVHDNAAMARGESCTLVYKGSVEDPNKLVASFHCMPAFRDRTPFFTVRTAPNSQGVIEVVEYQFAGSAEAHMVPNGQHAEHVNITLGD